MPRHAATRPFPSSSLRLCAFALSIRFPPSLPDTRTRRRVSGYVAGSEFLFEIMHLVL
jgi:hypothetical protein